MFYFLVAWSSSCSFKILLPVIEIVFEFFIKQHPISIAHSGILIHFCWFILLDNSFELCGIDDALGGSAFVRPGRRLIIDLSVGLVEFFDVVVLSSMDGTLIRCMSCRLALISSRLAWSRWECLVTSFIQSLKYNYKLYHKPQRVIDYICSLKCSIWFIVLEAISSHWQHFIMDLDSE